MSLCKYMFSCFFIEDTNIIKDTNIKNNVKDNDLEENIDSDEEENEKEILNKLYNIEERKKGRYNKYFYDNMEITKFELNNMEFYIRVINIYDGDTITGILFLYQIPYIIKIRLSDIDTPEMKPSNNNDDLDTKEKALAIICKVLLEKYIYSSDNNIIYIKTLGSDKYGRTLGKIYKNNKKNKCFNELLINTKLCDVYTGKTKQKQFESMYYTYKQSLEIIEYYENYDREVLLDYIEQKLNITI